MTEEEIQIVEWKVPKLNEPNTGLFYWIGAGSVFSELMVDPLLDEGRLGRYVAPPKPGDATAEIFRDEPKISHYHSLVWEKTKCAHCLAFLKRRPSRVAFVLNGNVAEDFVGGYGTLDSVFVHHRVKRAITETELGGAVFLRQERDQREPAGDYFGEYWELQGLHDARVINDLSAAPRDSLCQRCSYQPLQCPHCGTFATFCPRCGLRYQLREFRRDDLTPGEQLCNGPRLSLETWNGDDFLESHAVLVTGRVIEFLFNQHFSSFSYGPIAVEMSGANAQQRAWASERTRRLFVG